MLPSCYPSPLLHLHLHKSSPALITERMTKGRTHGSAATVSSCLSLHYFLADSLDSALSFIGSLAHFSHTHLGRPNLVFGPGAWVINWPPACSWFPCNFCSNPVSRMSWEMEPHRNTLQLGDGGLCCWKKWSLVSQAVSCSVKNQEKCRVVSSSPSCVFPWSKIVNGHMRKSLLFPR